MRSQQRNALRLRMRRRAQQTMCEAFPAHGERRGASLPDDPTLKSRISRGRNGSECNVLYQLDLHIDAADEHGEARILAHVQESVALKRARRTGRILSWSAASLREAELDAAEDVVQLRAHGGDPAYVQAWLPHAREAHAALGEAILAAEQLLERAQLARVA